MQGIRSINITLPTYPVSSNSSYTECNWVIAGNSLERVWVRFLRIDLPDPSGDDGHCDIAYLAFGGYSIKGDKIIHKRLCGRVLPDSYLTPSSSAWMTFVWTGKGGVMLARPVTVETEFTLKVSGNLFVLVICGMFIINWASDCRQCWIKGLKQTVELNCCNGQWPVSFEISILVASDDKLAVIGFMLIQSYK